MTLSTAHLQSVPTQRTWHTPSSQACTAATVVNPLTPCVQYGRWRRTGFADLGFLSPLAPYSRFHHLRLTRCPHVALPSQPKSGHTSAAFISLESAISASVLLSRLPRHHHHLACCISTSLETPPVYLSLHLLAILLPLHSTTTSPRGNNTFDRVYALFYIWAIGSVGIRVGTHTKTVC
jgi:hypothetical protein